MQEKLAADVAVPTTDYPHIPESLTLFEAMTIIKLKNWQSKTYFGNSVAPIGMIVFNKDLEFVGMVRRLDLMRGLMPGFIAKKGPKHREEFESLEFDPNVAEFSFDHVNERLEARGKRLVREIMTPIVTINHDDHLTKAMYQMIKHNTSQLAVIRDGTVIGVLRSLELLYELEIMLGVKRDPRAG